MTRGRPVPSIPAFQRGSERASRYNASNHGVRSAMSGTFDRLGILMSSEDPSADFLTIAQKADQLGFNSFWIAETRNCRGAIALAAAIGMVTKQIKIGLGILPVH